MKRNILFVLCLAISTTLAAAPNVVVSIMPLHGIVSDVMENVGEPALILKRNDSPHDYALRPSDARLMAASDLVIWVGPELEGFLRKPIANIADRAQLLTLAERQLPVVLSYKQGHGHDHDNDNDQNNENDDDNDKDHHNDNENHNDTDLIMHNKNQNDKMNGVAPAAQALARGA